MTDNIIHFPLTQTSPTADLSICIEEAVIGFAVEALDVRGRVVRLSEVVTDILNRHTYPLPVSYVLAEAIALTVMLGSSLKEVERFQLQTRTEGAISMIIVDYEQGCVRACATFDAARLPDTPIDAGILLGDGYLALTMEHAPTGTQESGARYQGIVALKGQNFEEAAHQYFAQSEQIPTKVRLAVHHTQNSAEAANFRVGGLMVQFLPSSPDKMRHQDLHAGDQPAHLQPHNDNTPNAENLSQEEDNLWCEARALVGTLANIELVDPNISTQQLLFRLFHEHGAVVYKPKSITRLCRCAEDKIRTMLQGFPKDDQEHMTNEHGKIVVTCEFCSHSFEFLSSDIF
jgi:molecular chaperone Hsp33